MISCRDLSLPLIRPSSTFPIRCAVTKQSERFLSTLSLSAGDFLATHKLIGKFVASSPKSTALNALSHLLSSDTLHPHLTSLALPVRNFPLLSHFNSDFPLFSNNTFSPNKHLRSIFLFFSFGSCIPGSKRRRGSNGTLS